MKIAVTTKGAADEVTSLTVNGVSLGTLSVNGNRFTFNGTLSDKSPQKINITIDEYIRFEDIVQPYPVLLRFKDENGNEVSWGGKFKVGSTITRIGSAADSNLLPNIYNIFELLLNGNQVTSSKVIVEKTMVFKAKSAYIFDNNEPKCILSPRLLRIPNSSYKILGYIPDISGHGNHGKINNSAYAGMSGANGYPNNFNGYTVVSGVTKTDSGIKVEKELIGSGWLLLIPANTAVASMKLNIVGIPSNKTIKWSTNVEGIGDITLVNGINEIPTYTSASTSGIYTIFSDLKDLKIEQIGEYEGAYCLDGVDDYISIPTLVTKQSLIKCNWTTENYNKFLLDYRKDNASNGYSTNKTGSTDMRLAYNGRVTYIDGILNKNLIPDDNLKGITHCAVIQYPSNIESETTIASAFDLRGYMQMALYTYIAFSEFSTEEKIKELNEYVGTEGNAE